MIRHKKLDLSATPLNPPEPAGRRKLRELAGEHPLDEQTAYLDRSQVDAAGPHTDTDIYEGELPAGVVEQPPGEAEMTDRAGLELLADIYERQLPAGVEEELDIDIDDLDLLTELELREGETSDPLVASDEAATYVPPIDPPVSPAHAGWRANAEIASGLGVSALDEPYDESHHSSFLMADDEVSARVREALRADSSTSQYADAIAIETRDGVVILRGAVDDLIDDDNLLAVASAARSRATSRPHTPECARYFPKRATASSKRRTEARSTSIVTVCCTMPSSAWWLEWR